MPSEKRARQRAARQLKRAAAARRAKRRKLARNSGIGAAAAAVIVGAVLLTTGHHSTTSGATGAKSTTTTTFKPADAKADQSAANKLAVAAGCPASPSTRVNTLSWTTAPAMTIDTSKTYTATVKTTAGSFVITLDAKDAPNTVNSFVFLSNQGFYHCVIFHRVIPGFMDQTGDPTGTGTGGPGYQFANENVPKSYAAGDVAMANSGPNTNGSQFFIVVPGGASKLSPTYSLFGKVTSGMSVVELINAEGNTASNGVPPKVVQRILSVKIHES